MKKRMRVWMRKRDGQLGERCPGGGFGPCWIYGAMMDDQKIDTSSPVIFIDDPRDPSGLHTEDNFEDLGPL